MSISVETNLDYLIDGLRLHLGDTTVGSYRYTDEWLRTSLVGAVKTLMRWWSAKYLIDDTTYNVERNTSSWTYTYTSPPLVQHDDEYPIILMASIVIKSGSLENASWNLGRWKDSEISYSNIASGNIKDVSVLRDWRFLELILSPPTKKLKRSLKGSLPGYQGNVHETRNNY